MFHTIVSIKNDGHYFCGAGGNRPDGLNEPVTREERIRALNAEIAPITENITHAFPGIGAGYYNKTLDLKYGQEPGVQFYTHISDQYSPFYTKVISRVRDSTHVLDGLLYHESDLEITEHYTDTAGFTEHVFALMHLLGFTFAPRIRDLHDKRLLIQGKADNYPALQSIISTTPLNLKEIKIHWNEILRLATSIKEGTVTASLMLKNWPVIRNRMALLRR